MATRRRTSQRRRTSNNVIDLTCDLDSDSEGDVLFVGEAAAPPAAAPAVPPPLREPDSPLDIVGMHLVVEPPLRQSSLPAAVAAAPAQLPPLAWPPLPQLAPSPPPLPAPLLAVTDYPRNRTETQLETELSDLAIDVSLLHSQLRERDAPALRADLELRLRQLRLLHVGLKGRVSQLAAGRRLRFEGLVRPLGAELDEVHRLLAAVGGAAWQQRDGGGPLRTRRSIVLDDSLPLPPPLDLRHDSPPQTSSAATQSDRPPTSPSREASNELSCPVCWETVSNLKEQQRGFLVTRCGHWFCEPCLKGACRVRRECPICRARLLGRPFYRPLYL